MHLFTIKVRFSTCISDYGEVIKYHDNNPSMVMYLSVRRISGRVKYLNTWPYGKPECLAREHTVSLENLTIVWVLF